jgi:hypothetical protein
MPKNSEGLVPRTAERPTASLRSVPATKVTSLTKATLEHGLTLTRHDDLFIISSEYWPKKVHLGFQGLEGSKNSKPCLFSPKKDTMDAIVGTTACYFGARVEYFWDLPEGTPMGLNGQLSLFP